MNANNQTAMTNEEAGGGADAGQELKAAPVAPSGVTTSRCDDRPNDSRRVEADKPGMTRNKSCAKARAYR
jgi:hypothetical protein